MGDVLPFERSRKSPKPKQGLCQHGFHKWKADKTTTFDTKSGKLKTRLVCERCGKVSHQLT